MNDPNEIPQEIPQDIEAMLTSYALGDLSPEEMDRVRHIIMESLPALTLLGDIRKTLDLLQTAFADSPAAQENSPAIESNVYPIADSSAPSLSPVGAADDEESTPIHPTTPAFSDASSEAPFYSEIDQPSEEILEEEVPKDDNPEEEPSSVLIEEEQDSSAIDTDYMAANLTTDLASPPPIPVLRTPEPLGYETVPVNVAPAFEAAPASVHEVIADLDDADHARITESSWDSHAQSTSQQQVPSTAHHGSLTSGGAFSSETVESPKPGGFDMPLWKQLPVQIAAGIAVLFGSIIYLRWNSETAKTAGRDAGLSSDETIMMAAAGSSSEAVSAPKPADDGTASRMASAPSASPQSQATRSASAVDSLLADLDGPGLGGSLPSRSPVVPLGRPSALPGTRAPVAPIPAQPLSSDQLARTGDTPSDSSVLSQLTSDKRPETTADEFPSFAQADSGSIRELTAPRLAKSEKLDMPEETDTLPKDSPKDSPKDASLAATTFSEAPTPTLENSVQKGTLAMPASAVLTAESPAAASAAPELRRDRLSVASVPSASGGRLQSEKLAPVIRVMSHIDVATGRLHPIAMATPGEQSSLGAAIDPIDITTHWVRSSLNGGTDFLILEITVSSRTPINARVLISWESSAVASAQPWPPRAEQPEGISDPRELLSQEMTLQPGAVYMLSYRLQDASASEAILGVARAAYTDVAGEEKSVRSPIRANEAATALDPLRRDMLLFETLQLAVAFPDAVDHKSLAIALRQDFTAAEFVQKAKALASSLLP